MPVRSLFPTLVHEARLADPHLLAALAHSIRVLAADDAAGRRWCRANGYAGYTSYASLDDLPRRDPAFATLARRLLPEARTFAAAAHMALGKPLRLDSLWVNCLKPGAGHSGHIHPNCLISGTFYVEVPDGAGGLRLEDPRLPLMMAAPPVAADAPEAHRRFVTLAPEPGTLYLWESWLRHEVPAGRGRGDRLSVSFNFA